MKVFKKLSMLFVAAAMMMTTVTTAFAQDGDNTPSITMKKDGSTFTAYRVLDGEKKMQVELMYLRQMQILKISLQGMDLETLHLIPIKELCKVTT